MSDLGKNWIRVLDAKRRKLYGKDSKLELFVSSGNSLTLVHSLDEGWAPRRSDRSSDLYEFAVDIWCLNWEDIRNCSTAKITSFDKSITYKLRPLDRQIIGQHILRVPIEPIG